jgi:hypothetical protein
LVYSSNYSCADKRWPTFLTDNHIVCVRIACEHPDTGREVQLHGGSFVRFPIASDAFASAKNTCCADSLHCISLSLLRVCAFRLSVLNSPLIVLIVWVA